MVLAIHRGMTTQTQKQMMDKVIAKLESVPGHNYRRDVAELALAEGLVDGDTIGLGQKNGLELVATVSAGKVSFDHGGKTTTTLDIATLAEPMHTALLIAKACAKATRGTVTGTIR